MILVTLYVHETPVCTVIMLTGLSHYRLLEHVK